MREIKFRAWDKVNKCFARRTTWLDNEGTLYVDADPNGIDMSGVRKMVQRPNQYEFAGQYTGLKDKNGKEIYEGDIVNDGYSDIHVSFSNGSFTLIWPDKSDIYIVNAEFDMQVIGNIYEKEQPTAIVSDLINYSDSTQNINE